MKLPMKLLSKYLAEMDRINDGFQGNPDNQLLVQCRENDVQVRALLVKLREAFQSKATSEFWPKYPQISVRFGRLLQSASLVALFSKLYSDVFVAAREGELLSVVDFHLKECHLYTLARAISIRNRLSQAKELIDRICREIEVGGDLELRPLFTSFFEKLRLAKQDASESVDKVRETFSAISSHFSEPSKENRLLILGMGATFGLPLGGMLSWSFGFGSGAFVPFILGVGFVSALVANSYNPPNRYEPIAKQQFEKYLDAYINSRRTIKDLLNEVILEARSHI